MSLLCTLQCYISKHHTACVYFSWVLLCSLFSNFCVSTVLIGSTPEKDGKQDLLLCHPSNSVNGPERGKIWSKEVEKSSKNVFGIWCKKNCKFHQVASSLWKCSICGVFYTARDMGNFVSGARSAERGVGWQTMSFSGATFFTDTGR